MQAIVLAGGFGTRLSKIITDVPKPMAPIRGRPFLEILLNNLVKNGFTKVVLSVGFKAEKITNHFGTNYEGMELVYTIEKTPLGTGGGVRLALDHISNDHAYIFNGDTFVDLEIALLEKYWQKRRRPIIVGIEVPDSARYGRIIVKGDLAVGFIEQKIQGPGLINAGCYVLSKEEMGEYKYGEKFSFEVDFLSPAVAKGEFDVFLTSGTFIDIGVPEDYERAQNILA